MVANKSLDVDARDLEGFHRALGVSSRWMVYQAALLDTPRNLAAVHSSLSLPYANEAVGNGTATSPLLSSFIFVEKSSPTAIRRILRGTQQPSGQGARHPI
jgi:hypothetical protein